jgi:hypothetical protein
LWWCGQPPEKRKVAGSIPALATQDPCIGYEAYWFHAGEGLVAVKDGLLISVNVPTGLASQPDRDRTADIELADMIVPPVGRPFEALRLPSNYCVIIV